MQHYLIIGASGGIGQKLAMLLAESGKRVIATYNKNNGLIYSFNPAGKRGDLQNQLS